MRRSSSTTRILSGARFIPEVKSSAILVAGSRAETIIYKLPGSQKQPIYKQPLRCDQDRIGIRAPHRCSLISICQKSTRTTHRPLQSRGDAVSLVDCGPRAV